MLSGVSVGEHYSKHWSKLKLFLFGILLSKQEYESARSDECLLYRRYVTWKISQASLTFYSLTYNKHMSQSYAVDCLLEPIFWFVDNFAGYLGRVSTTFVKSNMSYL